MSFYCCFNTIINEKLQDLQERNEHKKKVRKTKLESKQKKLEQEKAQLEKKHIEQMKNSFVPPSTETPSLDQDEEDELEKKVNIKVANLGSTSALKDTASEKRVIKHIERAIKDKLSKAGLETGGRQIEVKFITAGFPTDLLGSNDEEQDESMSSDETKQFQSMIYNLMVRYLLFQT